jgi:hypothetical protein
MLENEVIAAYHTECANAQAAMAESAEEENAVDPV